MNVAIIFEHGAEDRLENIGPFRWVQVTRDVLRVSRDKFDNGDVEIAHFDGDSWIYEGVAYSDFIVVACGEETDPAGKDTP